MLYAIPKTLIAGTLAACRIECGSSPQEGWALTLTLRGAGEPVNVAGTPDGDGYVVELPTTLTVGRWWWQALVTNGDESQVPLSGELLVEQNLQSITGEYDGRSEARIALDAINAVLANKATTDQLSYSIKGRSLTRYSVAELLQLRAFFVARVKRESGKSGFRTIGVRF